MNVGPSVFQFTVKDRAAHWPSFTSAEIIVLDRLCGRNYLLSPWVRFQSASFDPYRTFTDLYKMLGKVPYINIRIKIM